MNRRAFLASFTASAISHNLLFSNYAFATAEPLNDSRFFQRGFAIPAPKKYRNFLETYGQFKMNGEGIRLCNLTLKLKRYAYSVNKKLNDTILYRDESGVDRWNLTVDGGDCEDFAISKLDVFIKDGRLSRDNFSIATCVIENKIGHAVLVLHATDGDYILDNRFNHIPVWKNLPYSWRAIENHKNQNSWNMLLNFRKYSYEF